MSRGYKHEHTSIHLMMYHFIWIPKRRRKVLQGAIRTRLIELIHAKAKEMGSEIVSLEVMPDHVHLFIRSTPQHSPNNLIGQIKGYTSRMLRKEFPVLLMIPSLWTRSYWVSTAGNVSQAVIRKYIEEQTYAKDKHSRTQADKKAG
jgi:putative transposase